MQGAQVAPGAAGPSTSQLTFLTRGVRGGDPGCDGAPHPTTALPNTGSSTARESCFTHSKNLQNIKQWSVCLHTLLLPVIQAAWPHDFSPQSYLTVSSCTDPGDRSPELGTSGTKRTPSHAQLLKEGPLQMAQRLSKGPPPLAICRRKTKAQVHVKSWTQMFLVA